VVLTLPYRHAAELDALVAAQGDRRSPLFRRFLTPAQFVAYFAPSRADYAAVAAALGSAGFRVRTAPNRTIVDADAAAPVAARYFGTDIHLIAEPGNVARYANVRDAALPQALRARVSAVVGLDNLDKARFMTERAPRPAARPRIIGGPEHGPDGGVGPVVIARGYTLPVQSGYDGTGHTVAIVAGNMLDSDLAAFLSYFKIQRTGTTTRTLIQGTGGTNPNDPAVQEATLDAETVGALAPGAGLHLYIVENPIDAPGEDAYNTIVSDGTADIVNSGFGVCESQDRSYATAILPIVKQGVAEGISFDAATGNSGFDECAPKTWGENVPATLPQVVAIGGTTLAVDARGKYESEGGWSNSGGGVSVNYRLPTYQHGVPGLASTSHRNVPDLSFDADPYDGTSFYIAGAWAGPIGGTSWSTPIFSALQVEVNEKNNARAGFVNASIYAAFASGGYTAFHDVVTGYNGYYYCQPGYDNVTGIGSVKGMAFAGAE
jgi:kumamolisin